MCCCFVAWNDLGSNPRFVHTFIDEDSMRWVKGTLVFEIGFCACVAWYGWRLPILHLTELFWTWGIMARAHTRTRHTWLLKCTKLRPCKSTFILWHPFSHTHSITLHPTVFLIRPCGLWVQVESNEAFPIPKKELWLDLDSQSGVFLKQIDGNGS